MELQGRRALVTGGARGIGLSISECLIQRGACVAVADADVASAERAAQSLGENAMGMPLDVTEPEEFKAAIAAAVARFGGLDILINNAGIELVCPLVSTPDDLFRKLMDVNVMGVLHGIREAVPALSASGGGSIVNITSVAGHAGIPMLGAYCATSAAVLRLTQTAAIELRDAGIRVNAVCPALTRTEMADRIGVEFESQLGVDLGGLAAQLQGGMVPAAEVAEVVAFLVSDDAAFITGSAYNIDNALVGSVL